ncbi:uridine kinase [Stackebrandtia endophytica]|uniref:Uridine kinase n=1 Tax=Stackebrandtia endophytica TaxID=1496996 RepID=A0A543AWU0_9ACTN|nr:uridine kinase [Stackebrandtia endophytica]TQL77043.1 uridine kinase [Stackebrandtia endophytica]
MADLELLTRLRRLIVHRKPPDRPLIVGITGVDTAGKSRLATSLDRLLTDSGGSTQLIHVDDFHRPHSERVRPDLPEPQQFYRYSIDFPRLCRDLLEPIRRHRRVDVRLRLLDHYTDTWSIDRGYHVEPATVVVLEGIFLLRPEVRRFVDLMIFLEVDEPTVLARATLRDVPLQGIEVLDRYRRKYLPGQRRYLAAHPPAVHADIIVDNRDHAAPRVLKWPPTTAVEN